MGEKEIKPADGPKPTDQPKPDDHPHTQERPGTGAGDTGKGGGDRGQMTPKPGAGSGSSWSASTRFDDGYQMGRDSSGNTWMEHPDGGRATWDDGSQSWKGDDGSAKGSDWSQGHRPTDYGPQR